MTVERRGESPSLCKGLAWGWSSCYHHLEMLSAPGGLNLLLLLSSSDHVSLLPKILRQHEIPTVTFQAVYMSVCVWECVCGKKRGLEVVVKGYASFWFPLFYMLGIPNNFLINIFKTIIFKNTDNIKFAILSFFSIQFSSAKYLSVLQPFSRTLYILHNWNCMLNTSFHFHLLSAPDNQFSFCFFNSDYSTNFT